MSRRISPIYSVILHVAVVFALIHVAALKDLTVNRRVPLIDLTSTKIVYYPEKLGAAKGGGSGRDVLPASKGELPRVAPRAFVPPTTHRPDHQPELPVEPTIVGALSAQQPTLQLGDPLANVGPLSDGNKGGTGFGNSPRGRGGVGDKDGPSAGDGPGGINPGSQFGASTKPVLIYSIEPEFTEEARKARIQGTVVLHAEVDERGQIHNIKVINPLGLGLDEKAIEAVRKWKFRPAMKNGRPVRSPAVIEVRFHIL